ncbi:hypothetical protein EYF80_063582 [Liparis tanakae]|uniref:Uncharacterized protein n=1 Tax=Liparis tanakae TaxID=230148 RepID=A0A4Z2EC15_9TELE|nr:hypothetical protein EYF80_063582 [Liparis tanakae]
MSSTPGGPGGCARTTYRRFFRSGAVPVEAPPGVTPDPVSGETLTPARCWVHAGFTRTDSRARGVHAPRHTGRDLNLRSPGDRLRDTMWTPTEDEKLGVGEFARGACP